jgi:hypothetical protein
MRIGPASLFLAIALFLPAARAQNAAPADQELIRALMAKVDALEKRVRELETRAAPPAPAPAVQTAALPPVEHGGHDADVSQAKASPTINVRGFGDLGYSASRHGDASNSFAMGQLDLFLSSRLSEHLSVLMETVFEHGRDNSTGIDVERALLQYRPSRLFNVDVGRYHTQIGYYNTAFHHGTWFQTAIGRPSIFMFEDDGGLLPVHNVGVSIGGRVPSGSANLGYIFEIGNGRSYRPGAEQVQNRFDDNAFKAINIGLNARPSRLPGLRAGASMYRDRVSMDGWRFEQEVLAAHLVYMLGRTEFLNEAVWMRHTPIEGPVRGTTSIPAMYSQFSYRFGAVRPYMRYEYRNGPGRDPVISAIGAGAGLAQTVSLGARYDFSEFAAFKAQLARLSQDQKRTALQAAFQFAFTF